MVGHIRTLVRTMTVVSHPNWCLPPGGLHPPNSLQDPLHPPLSGATRRALLSLVPLGCHIALMTYMVADAVAPLAKAPRDLDVEGIQLCHVSYLPNHLPIDVRSSFLLLRGRATRDEKARSDLHA